MQQPVLVRTMRIWPRNLARMVPRSVPWQCRFAHTRAQSKWEARMSRLDSLFITGVTRFHEITGYSEIERLKSEVFKLEDKISAARDLLRQTRETYNQKLANRASSQREMNELLLRKQAWQTGDLERFTELYKDDHKIERDVNEAKAEYDAAEIQLEELQMQNGRLIGARYREEQLWSDKIRQASTWGTWILMGINILLFIVVQLVLEPWKRRKLVRSFEKQVKDMFAETEAVVQGGETRTTDDHSETIEAARPAPPALHTWNTLPQRFTEPELVLRPIETYVLAAGGILVGFVAALCLGTR